MPEQMPMPEISGEKEIDSQISQIIDEARKFLVEKKFDEAFEKIKEADKIINDPDAGNISEQTRNTYNEFVDELSEALLFTNKKG